MHHNQRMFHKSSNYNFQFYIREKRLPVISAGFGMARQIIWLWQFLGLLLPRRDRLCRFVV